MSGWREGGVHVHFFDESAAKIRRLEENIVAHQLQLAEVELDLRPLTFERAFPACASVLANPNAAKLVFIDQCGVDEVTPDVFRKLVNSPTCDFLFFPLVFNASPLQGSSCNQTEDHPAR